MLLLTVVRLRHGQYRIDRAWLRGGVGLEGYSVLMRLKWLGIRTYNLLESMLD
jgi:hypothetical protein